MISLGHVRELERSGHWHELIGLRGQIVTSLEGEELGRAYASLSRAYFLTATSAADYETALTCARECNRLAPSGSALWLWSVQTLSSILIDLGRHKDAERHALAFLAVDRGQASPYVAWVLRDLSHVAYRDRRFLAAANLRTKALNHFVTQGNTREVFRTTINLVWAYARAGKMDKAAALLPDTAPDGLEYLWHGAYALVLMGLRRYEEALEQGYAALRAGRAQYDYLDAAEVALILAAILRRRGSHSEASVFVKIANDYAVQQTHSAEAVHTLEFAQKGGELPDEAPARCGPAGHKHAGLRGVIG